MKTYQSSTKERKKNFFKRHKYAVTVVVSALVLAAVIFLAVFLTLPDKAVPAGGTGDVDQPNTDVDTKPTVVMPMTGATLGMGYADNKLVKWDTLNLWKWHPAIDFVGSGDVVAIMDGKVTAVQNTSLEGNIVTVTHDGGYVSIYKSLASDIPVKVGDEVKAGDKLGKASKTMMSELNTGDHLHLELKKDGKYVDPATVLPLGEDK